MLALGAALAGVLGFVATRGGQDVDFLGSEPPEGLMLPDFEVTTALSGGGADANVFNARGIPCLNLANGMAEIHTRDEHIAVSDLDAMVDVTLALVDAARA